ncbi:MAG: 16S rRNA (uracil(1498)-N(3))-methyltransferase [Chloroflexi bacterium]|nr:16S rRNA (uracil(1498)-N(3))-methyltransferase [Chloroflexota bacterium]
MAEHGASRRTRDATSNTLRFFVAPTALGGDSFACDDGDLAHQVGTVLRLTPGARIVALDGSGTEAVVRLEVVERRRLAGVVERRQTPAVEARLDVTLLAPLIRAERFEWLLQKATELGVRRIVPTACERSLGDAAIAPAKLARWQRVVREAAEQSRRTVLPALVEPRPFGQAVAALDAELRLVLFEGTAPPLRTLLDQAPPGWRSLAIISGPEGGLSDQERLLAGHAGARNTSLGPRTLRAETAPLVAATAALWYAGDLGG